MLKHLTMLVTLVVSCSVATAAEFPQTAVEQAATGAHRSKENIARNAYRHPVATLAFFGLQQGMTVIEISPGGLWYSEVLAPVLKGNGVYVAAGYDADIEGQPDYRYRQTRTMEQRFATEAVFSEAQIAKFSPPASIKLGEPASADMVVTFRNTHGWIRDGVDEIAFKSFFDVLKPGGVLGVVQHRGPSSSAGFSGYVTEAQMIKMAQKAGFLLEARSEINANPKDTKDYPKGVWTLPPSLRMGDTDQARYMAIGESDRMTLRFRKPN